MSSKQILESIINEFALEKLESFFRQKNDRLEFPKDSLPVPEQASDFSDGRLLAEGDLGDGKLIVCSFLVNKELTERSAKKAQYAVGKKILKEKSADAGIFIFYDRGGNFRFSLIYTNYLGKRRDWSNFRRFTYFVSKDLTNKTFLGQIGDGDLTTIEKIKEAFSVEKVTKEFYSEIANWFFWAMDKVKFPDDYKYSADQDKDKEIRNATNLIRLITRIIFIWFLKEKKLVPPDIFSEQRLKCVVKDFHRSKSSCNFYNAILQNLFFATLNQKIKDRKFADNKGFPANKKEYGVKTLYRYEEKFLIDKTQVIDLFKDIPFLNGGLFDCLDKEDKEGKVIYVDGFSRNPARQAIIPDYLFFQEQQQSVDLSEYGLGPNKPVKGLIKILNSYNFTIDENTAIDQEVALDPELLGKVFENLLASYNPETATTARKATGSYYTPREIVDFMVDESLYAYLKGKCPELPDDNLRLLLSYSEESPELSEKNKQELISAIDEIKIIDPACGSGAFPMGVLHKLVYALQKLDPQNNYWYELQYQKAIKESEEVFKRGDKREREERLKEINESFDESINYPDYARKLYLIENCIYGVDIQPIAIQISKLRFFISLVLDQKVDKEKENFGIRPLPNLETRFVAANTLIPLERPSEYLVTEEVLKLESDINNLRHKYFQAKTRVEKLRLQNEDRGLREKLSKALEDLGLPHGTAEKVAHYDLFDQNATAEFFDAEWMLGVSSGFDVLIGNPPHGADMSGYIDKIVSIYDSYDSRKNSASFFMNLSERLTRPAGIITYIIPKSLTFVDGWRKPREFLLNKNHLLVVIDISKSFENVLLEQVVVIYKNEVEKAGYTFRAGSGWHKSIELRSLVRTSLAEELDIIPCHLDNYKLDIYDKFRRNSIPLSEISKTFRGLPWQRRISNRGVPILRGRDIGRYCIKTPEALIKLSNGDQSDKNVTILRQLKIVSQNIVAHVMNPSDHIIIMASLDIEGLLTLDTCMNTILTSAKYSYQYVLALLNSKLASWFYYWFIYNRAIRTMHFDSYYMGKLPVKKIGMAEQEPFVSMVDKILAAKKENPEADTSRLEEEIDNLVYKLYGLTEEEIEIIENNAKKSD